MLNTPRSLEACKRAGILASDLVFYAYGEFRERELKFMG